MAFLVTPPIYIGDIHASNELLRYFFNTINASGVATTASSLAATATKIAGGASTTSGVNIVTDLLGVTGWHRIGITFSDEPTFWTVSADYLLLLTSGIVASTSLANQILCHFSIENRSNVVPVVPTRRLAVTAAGHAGIDWANIGSPTTAQNLTGTNISRVTAVSTVSFASVVGIVSLVSLVSTAAFVSMVGNVSTVSLVSTVDTVNRVGLISTAAISALTFTTGAINNAAFNVTETLNATIIAGGISAAAFTNSALTASVVDTSTRAVLANTMLGYDLSTVSQAASRSLLEANRFLRNRRFFSGESLIVTREDDTTQAWSATVTTASDVEAVTAIDPA